jgi:S-DNA-T family DNA segregation ATPase FtsK/SpoIIIE
MTRKRTAKRKPKRVPRASPNLAWLKWLREQGILGVLVLALAVVTMVGLFQRTSGTLIDWWSLLILRALGWGSYVVTLAAAAIGVLLTIGKLPDRRAMPWRSLAGAEIAFLTLLGLVHLLFAAEDPWAAARDGLGGGYIGAALSSVPAELLGAWLAGILLAAILLASLTVAAGLSIQEGLEWLEEGALATAGWVENALKQLAPRPAPPGSTTAGPARSIPRQARPVPPTGPVAASSGAPATSSTEPAASPARPSSRPRRAGREKIALPPLDLLDPPADASFDEADIRQKAQIIEETLAQFEVPARVIEVNRGPMVTQFGVEPGYVTRRGQDGEEMERKIRVSKIASLSNDLALALAAAPIRIEAPVPGRSIVGIEVPNDQVSTVSIRQVMSSKAFQRHKSNLTMALGSGVDGQAIVADLSRMPHLLIAGATGTGKSVCINAIATSLLYQNTPLTLRLVMIDPKRVELTRYDGLPHLYGQVEFDVERVVGVLRWLVVEMQARYKRLSQVGARHVREYNRRWQVGSSEYMPNIVVLIDELADLMFFSPEEVEKSICRLAQMARATGIHLVLATQRPSVDVVTGLIKANFPARISFAVSSGVDSRVILDTVGAETLLGKGDMLYMSPASSKLVRVQGSFISDAEMERVCQYWQAWAVAYGWEEEPAPWSAFLETEEGGDDLLKRAIEIVRRQGSASASMLQRRMHIGYPRAARLIDELEERGIVGPAESGGKSRTVHAPQGEEKA